MTSLTLVQTLRGNIISEKRHQIITLFTTVRMSINGWHRLFLAPSKDRCVTNSQVGKGKSCARYRHRVRSCPVPRLWCQVWCARLRDLRLRVPTTKLVRAIRWKAGEDLWRLWLTLQTFLIPSISSGFNCFPNRWLATACSEGENPFWTGDHPFQQRSTGIYKRQNLSTDILVSYHGIWQKRREKDHW